MIFYKVLKNLVIILFKFDVLLEDIFFRVVFNFSIEVGVFNIVFMFLDRYGFI